MIEVEWWEFTERKALAEQVADDVEFVIGRALAEKDHALLAVPGGTTPAPIFELLARRKIDWKKVTIILTDDRLVPAADPLSNFGLLQRWVGKTGAALVPLVDGKAPGSDPIAAGQAAAARLTDLTWPPDLVWLGMGLDGHCASILPGPQLAAALDAPAMRRAIGVVPDPLPQEAPVARVTLTRAALAAAHALIVVIAGAEKRAVLERATKEGDSSRLPIGRVLAASDAAIDVYWSET